ncbi:uncharacterized protein LOC128554736 isoform X2 [Mercenaria mercenaria]|uniref:uncharacterized protein LOC128554736 isoform X2 n=1 Tax=Mercenaria mercenaria TaxID=6596 RepID=UPI00234FB3A4|nr:uncharacterized protein LOC128554736 isoform X2 [Mercenaria mercenaria]
MTVQIKFENLGRTIYTCILENCWTLRMSAITEYTHLIPSLKVYPRVYFFSNRYRDVLDNFKTFAGRNQKILSESEIEVPRNDFENGLEVKVIGKEDLDPSAFVAAEPLLYERQLCTTSASEKEYHTDCIVPVNPLKYDVRSSNDSRKGDDKKSNTGENQFKTPEITLFICYATVENLNNEGLKQIKLLLNRVPERKDALHQECFLLCRSRNKFTQSEKDAFQEKIKICF